MPQPQEKLFDDIGEIYFIDNAARYKLLTDTISDGKHTDRKSIVQQIANAIKTQYYRRFRDVCATQCDDVVTDNPITRRVIFTNLVRSRYLIAAHTNASIISMFGHGARSFKIRVSSEREIDLLQVETENSAVTIIRIHNPLPPITKVNLRTLDNVFVYTDIIEQSLIRESQANLLGYFPIKSHFGETGYWCFTPPCDNKVIQNFIDTISIKLTRMNGELFPFKNGQIIIRLLYKRVK